VLCESALDGVPITPQMAITRYGEIADAATDWLIRLATTTVTDDSSHAHWHAMVERLVRRFRRFYGPVADPGLLSRITDMLQHVAPPACVCEHRDFSPWNLLIDDRGHLAVADWESSQTRGVAGPDLMYFLTYLAFYREGLLGARSARASAPAFRSAYRQAWTTTTETGRINNACVTRYSRTVALEPAAARPLRMLTWLIHSSSEYRRAREDAQGNPNPQSLRRGLFLNLLELECDG
jgi:aminoglycoside phosphotransferase (APT) family kinase protein